MAKKPLSFLEQAQELERDNKRLRESLNNYQKLADAVLKAELNMDLKSVKKALANSGDSHSNESIFAAKTVEQMPLSRVNAQLLDRGISIESHKLGACISYIND